MSGIAGIKIGVPINNNNLPVGSTVGTSILADPHLKNWFQAESTALELDNGDIISFIDKKGGTDKLTRAGTLNMPALTPSLFGSWSGARFVAANSDRMLFNGAPKDFTLPFSWVGVARMNGNAASMNLLGTFSTSSARAILNVSVGTSAIRFQYGGSSTPTIPITVGQAFAFACGYDGSNIFLRVNGTTVTFASSGSPGTSVFALGALPGGSQYWDGDVSDLWMCDIAVNSPAGADLLEKMRKYILGMYGVNL